MFVFVVSLYKLVYINMIGVVTMQHDWSVHDLSLMLNFILKGVISEAES
jgi:hypothetical protein